MKTKTPSFNSRLLVNGELDHEALMLLLLRQREGLTTRKENAFIKRLLQENAGARDLLAEIEETSGYESWVSTPRNRFPLTIAAGVALLIMAGAGYFFLTRSAQPPLAWHTIEVPKGANRTIHLEDGSKIVLNAATTLRYPADITRSRREIYVDGEAFFTVSANAARPFIVHTSLADVEVLGTSFNINTYDGRFRVALQSGAVAVATNEGQKIKLQPGYAASLDTRCNQLLVHTFSSDTVQAWLGGTYHFSGKSLKEVCRMAERIYNITIVVEDEALFQSRHSGAIYQKQPLQDFLEDLICTAGADYYFDQDGKLHLKKAE